MFENLFEREKTCVVFCANFLYKMDCRIWKNPACDFGVKTPQFFIGCLVGGRRSIRWTSTDTPLQCKMHSVADDFKCQMRQFWLLSSAFNAPLQSEMRQKTAHFQ